MQLIHARSAERDCTFFEIKKISEDSRIKMGRLATKTRKLMESVLPGVAKGLVGL
jgi:hypothetical protein